MAITSVAGYGSSPSSRNIPRGEVLVVLTMKMGCRIGINPCRFFHHRPSTPTQR